MAENKEKKDKKEKKDAKKIKKAVSGDSDDEDSKKEKEKEKEPELTDLPGIGPAIASKLESAGVYDLMSLAVMNPAVLSDTAGMGTGVARKAIVKARDLLELGFQDGMEFAKKRSNVNYITTGSEEFNALLGGKGVESRAITECYGAYGSGKCISKDTNVCYFNPDKMHVEQIQETYEKYKKDNEFRFEEGFAIPINSVKVLAWADGKFKITKATNLYREKVRKLFLVKTRRGRVLKVTGKHKLLSFNKGVNWKKTRDLKKGDLIASPKKINLTTKDIYTKEDSYFLGLFVAEGSSNPFSISTGSEKLKQWVCEYINKKFGYMPTVKKDNRRENICYTILLRKKTRRFLQGLDKCHAGDKFIPEEIFFSDDNVIMSFLGGYFEGDAEVSKNDISVTTKSKKLASQLSYLLLRLGVASSIKDKKVKGNLFKVVRICGEDRKKLKKILFKIKSFDCSLKNSSYGYPRKIVSFLSELYKQSIGGNRGRLRKTVGKANISRTVYSNLIDNYDSKVINEVTLNKMEKVFENQRDLFVGILNGLKRQELNTKSLRDIFPHLPFAFNSLAKDMNLKKNSIRNYYSRNLPKTKAELLKNLIVSKLKTRVDSLCLALEIIYEIKMFNWDTVESIKEIDYDDYVYDFVVPDGHSFLGGNMPTMMHNTQLGLTLAVNSQLPEEKGGANGKTVFIDTEGTFRPTRIKQIAEGVGASPEKVLKNILVARAFNSDHQMLLLEKIGEMVKDGEPIKLLIVDSLTAHFRAEFSGRGQLADRQQKLNRYMHNIIKLAETYNLAVYVTNQVMANPAQLFGDPTTAIGGNIVGHACLIGDSLIQLSDGSINEIRNMNQEEVVSGDFRDLKFNNNVSDNVFINPNVKKVYNIKTNHQINCSPLHKFFTIENFSIVEKEAKELKKGDFIMQAGKISITGKEQKLPCVNVKKICKFSKEDGKKISSSLKKEDITRKEICKKIGITSRQFRRVLNQGYPTDTKVFDALENHFSGRLKLKMVPVQTYKHRDLTMPQLMVPELSQICGYFLGDGNFESRGLRFKDERKSVLIYYQSLFKQIFNIDGKITKVKNKNCYCLSINSKEIKDLFQKIFLNIFNYIGKSKKEVVRGFIKGFVDAEGHINEKRVRITIAQKEKNILRYLQLFLLRFGIRSTIGFDIGKKNINILRIFNRDIANYLQIGFTSRNKQQALVRCIKKIENTYDKKMMPIKRTDVLDLLEQANLKPSKIIRSRSLKYNWINKRELEKAFNALMNAKINDRQIKQKIEFIFKLLNSDLSFEKIRDIQVEKNNGELFYDFSVPESENYVANGFVVHNSTYRIYLRRGKKDSRVAKLVDSPNLPDNEAIFHITKEGIRDKK